MSSIEAMREDSLRSSETGRNRENGRFEPGYSGNPGGRPKQRWSLLRAVEEYLESNPNERDSVVARVVESIGRDQGITKQYWDRSEGTVTERSETLLRNAETNEMSREAILIAAEAIKRQDAEKEASTLDVEAGLPSEGTSEKGDDVPTL